VVNQASAAVVAEEQLEIVTSAATHEGGRSGNEDAMAIEQLPAVGSLIGGTGGGHLMVIADGMGGYLRGEVASQMAVDVVRESFREDPAGDPVPLLKQAFRRANDQIFATGQGANPPQMMGTTLVAAVIRGKYATVASIGDSRAYLLRAGRLNAITRDHSLVAEQVEHGQISPDEARESPHRNILTHALGHRPKLDSKMPSVFELTLLAGDKLFLCTDGFYDVVTDADLQRALSETETSRAAETLVQLAIERGTSDNVTAIVASVEAERRELADILGPGQVAPRSPLVAPIALAAVLLIALLAVLLLFVI
jgi:protein phosphatase